MPALVLFRRSWMFGSDDLTFPAFAGVVLRGTWLVALSVVFGLSYHDFPECNEGKLAKIYFYLNIALLSIQFLLQIIILIISTRGTVMDPDKRSSITKFIYLWLIALIPEIVLTAAGTVWIFHPGPECEEDIVWSIRALIIFQWLVLLLLVILTIVFFNPLGKRNSHGQKLYSRSSSFQQAIESEFERTFFCRNPTGNQREAFTEIARALALVFKDVDLVPSDIVAGLILLNGKQQLEAEEQSEESIAWLNEHLVPIEDKDTWAIYDTSKYYFPFALGAYGCLLYCYMHLCCGICHLCRVCKCGCARQLRSIVIEGDTCCKSNTSGVISQLSPDHINVEQVFTSFRNDVYQTAFCVSIDHENKNVVVSVRGTLSFKDVLTDLTAETESLELDSDKGCEEKCRAHKGMVRSAQFILTKLEDDRILESIFLRCPDYNLLVVGHSLGAGTGAILSILMKKKYESLKCFAYSPPQTLNLKAALHCEEFVTSIVLGNDIISRLGIHSIDVLKNEIIDILKTCELPKYQILLGGCWKYFCGCIGRQPANNAEERTLLLGRENKVAFYSNVLDSEASINVNPSNSEEIEKLYCPGRILQFVERSSNLDLVHGDREAFEKIAIVPNLMANHMPDNVKKAYGLLSSPKIL
ncbi:diacylglycerol lipase-alpha-like [Xenia sp. Carnegie-2017]|uniref:diacylglycerol lipase-alpha-like n=1 Tax=Xenia sp. Carnegie-2017 TaxID=2897299 RepID=UPI001F047594|nr:diacylglycerol lipase-alpha-like [Xenia sp. Carnegie-2017]